MNDSTMNAALRSLRDIEGVVGSFVVDDGARVVGSDLPSFFDLDALNLAAPRLRRLGETLSSRGQDFQQGCLRYASHQLWLQPGGRGLLLCVLIPLECNLAALRMGAHLVVRKLASVTHERVAPADVSSASTTSGTRSSTEPERMVDIAAQSTAELPTPAIPGATSSASGSTWRSRVPGASASRSGQRQFRGRVLPED